MSDHRSKRRAVIGLLVAAQVPCVALGLLSAVVVAHRMTVVQGYELAESVPLILAVVATVYVVTLVVTILGSLVIGLPLGALARRLGWRTWRTWRGLALRGVAVGQLAAPAVVFIVAVLGGEPVALEALIESFSAKTMIAGALLGTLAALMYWRIVHRRQTRFGTPLLSDLA